MKELIFISGGVRSGKSNFGQTLAEKLSKNPVYLATSKIWDVDFEERIIRHQQQRGNNWKTIEEEKYLSKHSKDLNNSLVLLDCVTLWITNFYEENNYQLEPSLEAIKKEWQRFHKTNCTCIVISNEIGMGLHGDTKSVRKFVDLQGFVNQYIASMADKVHFMVSGIPMRIK